MYELIFASTLFAGVLIAALAASLGTIVLWQRMSFFGDALAHSLALGVALDLVLFSDRSWGSALVGLGFVLCIVFLRKKTSFAPTTLLYIVSQSLLAIGILLAYYFSPYPVDLHSLFFGDPLSIRQTDFVLLAVLCGVSGVFLVWQWKPLLLISLDAGLAQAEGIPVQLLRNAFLLLLTMTVMSVIRMTGILLISSILVLPTASARNLAKGPQSMLMYALCIGVCGMIFGVLISFLIDVPLSPLIVVLHGLVFACSVLLRSAMQKRRLSSGR